MNLGEPHGTTVDLGGVARGVAATRAWLGEELPPRSHGGGITVRRRTYRLGWAALLVSRFPLRWRYGTTNDSGGAAGGVEVARVV